MNETYDVVVLGGAIAGASTALQLRRRFPELRVLIIERNPAFDWKVGESTVEASGYFLTRVLKIYDHLSREQLPKQGFRYWFHNGTVTSCRDASEVGGFQLSRTPGFQLDRAKLDEHVLALAEKEGSHVWRPAKILDVQLAEEIGGTHNVVRVERDGVTHELRTPWVVDATGRAAVISRKRGWLKPLHEHPTSSIWARFRNVKDLDGIEIGGTDPDSAYSRGVVSSRRLATNHFNGYGYWMWFIPLQGGETSIGAVWDRRIVEPQGKTMEEKLRWFLDGNPLTKELTEGAHAVPGDLRMYANLPYTVERACGATWSLVGDAAGFLDPFYSPGLDQVAYSTSWTLELVHQSRTCPDPKKFAALVASHNKLYAQFWAFYFKSIYKDKYYLMGDYDLMSASFLIDTSLYYYVLARALYKKSSSFLRRPPYYLPFSGWACWLIGFYNRRLISIGKRKWRLGIYGNRNAKKHPKLPGFSLGGLTAVMLTKGLLFYYGAEIRNFLSYFTWPKPLKAGMPGPYAMPKGPAGDPEIDVPPPVKGPERREETVTPAVATGAATA